MRATTAVQASITEPSPPGPSGPESPRHLERQRWERVAASFPDFFHAPTTQYYRRCEIALLRRTVGSLKGLKVLKLDLWNEAFNTRILHWMAEQGAEVYGMDLSWRVTFAARRNGRAVGVPARLLSADIRELPWARESFDLVYTMGTIEHIAEYRNTLAEIYRVLRPGGRAIVGVPHRWDPFLRPLVVRLLERWGKYPYAPEKSFSASELRRDLEAAGLRVLERTGILTLPGLLRMADVYCYTRGIALYRLSPLVVAPFQYLETRWRWPGRLGYLLTMVAQRPAAPAPSPGTGLGQPAAFNAGPGRPLPGRPGDSSPGGGGGVPGDRGGGAGHPGSQPRRPPDDGAGVA